MDANRTIETNLEGEQRTIKFSLDKNHIRRVSVAKNKLISFSSLCGLVCELYSFSRDQDDCKITWVDDEGDVISISSDHELAEAIQVMGKISPNGYLKFDVSLHKQQMKTQKPKANLREKAVENNSLGQLTVTCHYCQKAIPEGVRYQAVSEISLHYCPLCEEKLNLSKKMLSIKLYHSDHQNAVEDYLKGLGTFDSSPSPSPSTSTSFQEPRPEKLWKFLPKRSNGSDCSDWRRSQASTTSTSSSWGDLTPSRPAPGKAAKPMCRFIRDVSFLDGEKIAPATEFIKIWRVKNDGNRSWPEGCWLAPAGGDHLQVGVDTKLPQLEAGEEIDISVTLLSPSAPGRYVSYFRPQTQEGRWFGQRLWSDIRVSIPETFFENSETFQSPNPDGCVDDSSQTTTIAPSAWAHELSLLANMGFMNEAECLTKLEKYSMKSGLLTGQTRRSSAEVLQLTVSDLLRR
jgi:hypothetical protein